MPRFAGLLLVATVLTGCGLLPGTPQWCGQIVSGGGMPPSGSTPDVIPTPDPTHLVCIAVANRSQTDLGMTEIVDGVARSWSRIPACEGMDLSEPMNGEAWAVEFGRSVRHDGTGDGVLRRFDSSQLTGVGPYLIEVVINPDLAISVEQKSSMLADAATRQC